MALVHSCNLAYMVKVLSMLKSKIAIEKALHKPQGVQGASISVNKLLLWTLGATRQSSVNHTKSWVCCNYCWNFEVAKSNKIWVGTALAAIHELQGCTASPAYHPWPRVRRQLPHGMCHGK